VIARDGRFSAREKPHYVEADGYNREDERDAQPCPAGGRELTSRTEIVAQGRCDEYDRERDEDGCGGYAGHPTS
jgi:hypothetical protein